MTERRSMFPLPRFTRGGQAIGYDAMMELHERLEALEGGGGVEGGELAARVQTLEEKAEQLTPGLVVQVDENTEGIDVHDQRLLNLSNDLAAMFDRLNAMEAQIQTNSNNLNNIGERVVQLESRPQNG